MRILQVLHDFLPETVAGVEVYTDSLSRFLAREHEVALLYAIRAPESENYALRRGQHRGVETFEIVNNRRFSGFEETYQNPRIDERVGEVIDAFRPDVVHVQHLINLSMGLVREFKRREIPVVMTLHDHWLACANGGQRFHRDLGRCEILDPARCGACTAHMSGLGFRVRVLLERISRPLPEPRPDDATPVRTGAFPRAVTRAIKRTGRAVALAGAPAQHRRVERRWQVARQLGREVDLFLTPSQYLRDELVRFGLPKERLRVVPNGFEAPSQSRREALPEVARNFAFIGSLMPHKGVHLLLEAFDEMPADARLDICGSSNSNLDYAESLRAGCRHPGIRFLGRVEPEGIPDFLTGVDCLVVPSLWHENAPLTIQEAFLSGVPVIASRVGGHSELLARGGGLLYDPDDPAELAKLLARLYQEPGLARSLGANPPPVQSMRNHAAELTTIYESLQVRRQESRDSD